MPFRGARSFAERMVYGVSDAPEWLQPALGGAGIVFLFMLARGGLVIIPLVLLIMAFTHPAQLPLAIGLIFVMAPGAGFLGGLFYGVVGRLAGGFGRFGKYLQFAAGAWVYCMLLVFVIMPLIEPGSRAKLPPTVNLIIATGMGLLFGGAMYVGWSKS